MSAPEEPPALNPMDDPDYRRAVEMASQVPPIDWHDLGTPVSEVSPVLRAVAEDERAPMPHRVVDLSPFLDGTYVAEVPSVGATREDGIQMLYRARWHTVIGPTEAGKSWLGLVHAVAVLVAGGIVLYLHFEETTPAGTVARLIQLGVDREVIRKRFIWVDCANSWQGNEFAYVLSQMPEKPGLVVLDGINACCTLQGWDVEKTSSVGEYRRIFVIPATAGGAAVFSLGHPVKSQERAKERHGFGSTAWLDEVDGVGFRLIPAAQRISRGALGYANVFAVKDRNGEVARHALFNPDNPEGWRSIATLKVDDTGEQTQCWLNVPHRERPPEAVYEALPELEGLNDSLSDVARRIVTVIADQPDGAVPSMTALKALMNPKLHGNSAETGVAELLATGALERFDGPKASKGLRLSTCSNQNGPVPPELPELDLFHPTPE